MASVVRLAATLSALLGCAPPTQVTIEITTDLSCDRIDGVTVAVSGPNDLGSAEVRAATSVCTGGRVGSLVVVPSGSARENFALRVAAGVGVDPRAVCTPENDYGVDLPAGTGCIVARRSLGFIDGTPLELPIVLRDACLGVPCAEHQTCVQGICRSIALEPSECAGPTGCGEETLPLPPGVLGCGRQADFSTGALPPGWQRTADSAIELAVEDGGLVFTVPPQLPKDDHLGVWSAESPPLQSCPVTVDLEEVPPLGSTAGIFFGVQASSGHQIFWYLWDGIYFRCHREDKEPIGCGEETPVPRRLTLRADGDEVIWEDSVGGKCCRSPDRSQSCSRPTRLARPPRTTLAMAAQRAWPTSIGGSLEPSRGPVSGAQVPDAEASATGSRPRWSPRCTPDGCTPQASRRPDCLGLPRAPAVR
jgi:hypothetical protein